MQGNFTIKFFGCSGCGTPKPRNEFPIGTNNYRERYCYECRARTEKPCAECGLVQPIENYTWKQGRNKRPRRDATCRSCRAIRTREWTKRVGKRSKRSYLMRTYGITEVDVAEMILAQGGACAICGDTEMPIDPRTGKAYELAIDHCHATGKLRALLCPGCNSGLGCFRDSLERLHAAINYLKRHSS